jgi:Holliday junction resolvase RusA-like endonuclease
MEASLALFPDDPGPAEPYEPPASIAPSVSFIVYGTPAPAGSKKVVPMGKRFGVIDDSKRSRPWKNLVAQQAGLTMDGRALLRGPLKVSLRFVVRRPKGHFGKRGLLPSAPAFPTVKPDVLKLARSVEDSMSGTVYADDAQIVKEMLVKEYGEQERVEVQVWELAR